MRFNEFNTITPEKQIDINFNKMRNRLGKIHLSEGATVEPAAATNWFKAGTTLFRRVLATAKAAVLAEPIYNYIKNMSQAEDNLKQDGNEARYNEIHVVQAGRVIAGLAANLAILFTSFVGDSIVMNVLKFIPGFGPLLSGAYYLLSTAGKLYVMDKLATPAGREAIAELISVSTLKKMGEYGVAAIDWLHETFLEAAGLDKSKSTITPLNTPDNAAHPTTPAVNEPADPKKPNKDNDYMIPRIADPESDYTPPGYKRDKNGFMTY